jgi:hypothetical protein
MDYPPSEPRRIAVRMSAVVRRQYNVFNGLSLKRIRSNQNRRLAHRDGRCVDVIYSAVGGAVTRSAMVPGTPADGRIRKLISVLPLAPVICCWYPLMFPDHCLQ